MNDSTTDAGRRLQKYRWPAGRQSAVCLTVDVDAESVFTWAGRHEAPSKMLGQMEQRQFGPRVGIWRLLELFARHDVKATFFVPGQVAENYPQLLPTFVAAGHEIGLHGYHHELPWEQSSHEEFIGALEASIEVFRKQVGLTPKGFRAPGFDVTKPMLDELRVRGLYDSSLMGCDHPYTLGDVIEVPVQWVTDDAIHFKFAGRGDHWSAPGPVLEGWLDEWRMIDRFGELFMLTLHDWISGRAAVINLLERFISTIKAEPRTWIATVGEVADHHRTSANRYEFQFAVRTPESLKERRFGQD